MVFYWCTLLHLMHSFSIPQPLEGLTEDLQLLHHNQSKFYSLDLLFCSLLPWASPETAGGLSYPLHGGVLNKCAWWWLLTSDSRIGLVVRLTRSPSIRRVTTTYNAQWETHWIVMGVATRNHPLNQALTASTGIFIYSSLVFYTSSACICSQSYQAGRHIADAFKKPEVCVESSCFVLRPGSGCAIRHAYCKFIWGCHASMNSNVSFGQSY